MPAIAYKLYLGDEPATRQQLDWFEEISVQQEVDMAWEARLQIPLCTNPKGNWTGEADRFIASFQRVRVEVAVGRADWVALIDGPITGYECEMSGDPGRSTLTLLVRDDSVYLTRKEEVRNFGSRTISDVAAELLIEPPSIATAEADIVDGPPPLSIVQRGSAIHILRELARCADMHVYVLPGDKPGHSAGKFKKFPERKDGLPNLVLMGPDRNVGSLRMANDSTAPAVYRRTTIQLADREVQHSSSTMQDLKLLGTDPPLEKGTDPAKRLLSPECQRIGSLDAAVRAETNHNAYLFHASGQVVSECYAGVLSPYRLVTLLGANGRQSGEYLLTKVTHTLNRNFYGQAFSLARNARSAGTGAVPLGPLEAIFE